MPEGRLISISPWRCRCGHRVTARARSGLYRLLTDRQEVTA
jgi:hypothetical protein